MIELDVFQSLLCPEVLPRYCVCARVHVCVRQMRLYVLSSLMYVISSARELIVYPL